MIAMRKLTSVKARNACLNAGTVSESVGGAHRLVDRPGEN